MADDHKGYVMPIGGVAAYRDKVSVVGVGFDIACGNAAVLTDRTLTDYTTDDLTQIADVCYWAKHLLPKPKDSRVCC
jgi:RNA-splicing ligase RtcB